MNKGVLTIGIIFLGLIALLLINVLTNYSTGSELDYYLVKETTEAAIEDAMDLVYYNNCGLHRMDKEKFVESFVYRFAINVDTTREYHLKFYDINEVPPKVSVQVDSLTVLSTPTRDGTDREAATISTRYDAIVESTTHRDFVEEDALINYEKNPEFCKSLK